MNAIPTEEQLIKTLYDAAKVHHEFQSNFLDGVRHQQWAWWYSAYVLGRLGDFTTATLLTEWLDEVAEEKPWFKKAAAHIVSRIKTD